MAWRQLITGLMVIMVSCAPVRAEGFFSVSVVTEDHADWPKVRLLLAVADAGGEVLVNESWETSSVPRYPYGFGGPQVWTFLPDPTDPSTCFGYDEGLVKPVCWEIGLTHEGQEITGARQIFLPILRDNPMAHLWIEYEAPDGLAPPEQEATQSMTVFLQSVQGNRTSARQPELTLYGGAPDPGLAHGPWAFLNREAERQLAFLIEDFVEWADADRKALYRGQAAWAALRDADCRARAAIHEDAALGEREQMECFYEHAILRLNTIERMAMGLYR